MAFRAERHGRFGKRLLRVASRPSSKYCLRTLAMVGWLTSIAYATFFTYPEHAR